MDFSTIIRRLESAGLHTRRGLSKDEFYAAMSRLGFDVPSVLAEENRGLYSLANGGIGLWMIGNWMWEPLGDGVEWYGDLYFENPDIIRIIPVLNPGAMAAIGISVDERFEGFGEVCNWDIMGAITQVGLDLQGLFDRWARSVTEGVHAFEDLNPRAFDLESWAEYRDRPNWM